MRDLLGKINLHKQILLKSILEEFKSQGLQPKIGIELEFYLSHQNLPASEDLVTQFIIDLKSQIKKHNIFLQ